MRRTTKPEWYQELMSQSFHEICTNHSDHFLDCFCLYCHRIGCCRCADLHPRTTSKERVASGQFLKTQIILQKSTDSYRHPIMQVFDLLEHDAVWLNSISAFVDCSGIQTHDLEGRKLVVLKPKQQVMTCLGTCRKLVRKPFKFCSVACKVNHLSDHEADFTQIFKNYTFRVDTSTLDTNDCFGPHPPPKRPVDLKAQKNPKLSQGLTQSVEYDIQNALVERCARQPGSVHTSHSVIVPAVGYNDQNAHLQRSPATTSSHDQLQRYDFDNAGERSILSGSEWLLGAQDDQNALLQGNTATNSGYDELLGIHFDDAREPIISIGGQENDQNVPDMPLVDELTVEEDRAKDEPKKCEDEQRNK